MRFDVVTLFREMIEQAATWNPRDFATDNYRTVDDRPYGGGPGMVMLGEPLSAALGAAREAQRVAGCERSWTIHLSPSGRPLTHARVAALAADAAQVGYVLVAGRYEGIDERWLAREVDEEVAVGDFVVSGGELPALMLMDAVVRLQPGVLNDAESAAQESFVDGLLGPGRSGTRRAAVGQPRGDPPLAAEAGAGQDVATSPRAVGGTQSEQGRSGAARGIPAGSAGGSAAAVMPAVMAAVIAALPPEAAP